ncbi:hypothetical protein FACS1894151_00440 [Spirochaetia bacterium]|nr:hypothetical protein FACS1894151_00440 [Spirochaetia bacterium]
MKFRFQALVLCAALLFPGCRAEELPHIEQIEPRIGKMGDIITIYGERFGTERDDSYITIGGYPPITSAYIQWDDTEITIKTPESGSAGLVYLYRGNKKSNAALFSVQETIPQPVVEDTASGIPLILSISPLQGAPGQLIKIQGRNFGPSREGSGVYFSWNAENSPSAPVEAAVPLFVEAFENDMAYESWSEREINVRIPDGAVSGGIEIRTPRGVSRGEYFEVTGKPGTKTFREKHSYVISYSVDIRVREALQFNSLYLWIPKPVSSASQRNTRVLSREIEPYIENYRGTSLFRLSDLAPDSGISLTQSYLVDVYTTETSVNPQLIRVPASASALNAANTKPSAIIPSDDPEIKRFATTIVGREQNPYRKALAIYNWICREVTIQSKKMTGGALEALENRSADAYMASLLFCAFARASGVPAIPVAGILVDKTGESSTHFWAEFWLDNLGWIPADPALGAGAAPPQFSLGEDHAAWYFGNIDNQRIAFSRGEVNLSQMDSRGRTSYREREYSLQNLWEEAGSGMESYSSLWSGITINGVYVE